MITTKKVVAFGTVLTIILISCNNILKGTDKDENGLVLNETTNTKDILSTTVEDNKDSLESTNSKHQSQDTSLERKMKIQNLKRDMSMKMQEIGRNPNLSGYEKGMQKRAVKMKYQQEIQKIVNSSISTQESSGYQYYNQQSLGLDKRLYDIETKLDELEDEYEDKIEALEDQEDYLPKSEYKSKKNSLKLEYKNQKETLKTQRDQLLYQ